MQKRLRIQMMSLVVGALLASACGSLGAQEAEKVVLRFDNEMATVINARRWDETKQQWLGEKDEMFFDAVHRFLLLRFPGCAQTIRQKLVAGYEIESVRLVLHWQKQEWLRAAGYQYRGYVLKGKPEAKWHARVWVLRRPWADDPRIGPTWNAYINGAGYWRQGGGRDEFYDRFPKPLGEAGLWEEQSDAEVDLTDVLASKQYGNTLGERLRLLEACGFLIRRAELYNREYPENGVSTGVARMWIKDPELVVALRKAETPAPLGELPPPVDVRALAARLAAQGGDGFPTTVIPENLEELARAARTKPADMPDWMWKRVQEVRNLKIERNYAESTVFDEFESGDRDRYIAATQLMLARPPAWFMGHSHVDFLLPLLRYEEMLPGVLRYHIRRFFLARWEPPYNRNMLQHRVGYYAGMATLNHQSQFRSEALLAGETLGMSDLVTKARYGLSLLNRQMIYSEGTIQERGDTFYLAISLSNWQAAAKYSVDPLSRLKASLTVEKIMFENNSTYHPGLRRRVSRVSRRYRLNDLILAQDAPRAALHTLSKKGVLIETDKLRVHDIPTLNLHACPPVRVAMLAPWGREWESNAIDEKPLPFLSVATDYVRKLLDEPIYNVTYLGRNYGLASMNSDFGVEYPVLAVWRRPHRTVEKLDDLGIMFLWAYMNDAPVNRVHQDEPVGVRTNPRTGILQHGNKMIYALTLPERGRIADVVREGLKNVYSRVHVYAYGPPEERELWINDRRIEQCPATARQGDVITMREGVSYVGLIPLPATDLGRKQQVVIRYEYPLLSFDSYVLESDEPLPDNEQTWRALSDVTAGWIVELGDVDEYGSFQAFQQHMRAARLRTRWEPEKHTLHVSYASGKDTLDMGLLTTFERPEEWSPIPPSKMMAYQRVNGRWPWPDRGIDMDCPLGQMGKSARLEKGGAVLETLEGQMALLKIEPISGTYEGVNPFIDPQPFELRTPEGVIIRSEGPIGCARVTVRPKENMLWVDYYLPPPEGDRAVETLQENGSKEMIAGGFGIESPIKRYFRPGTDVRDARRDSARALIVSGVERTPAVILNGKPLDGPFARFARDGKTWYRIPVVTE